MSTALAKGSMPSWAPLAIAGGAVAVVGGAVFFFTSDANASEPELEDDDDGPIVLEPKRPPRSDPNQPAPVDDDEGGDDEDPTLPPPDVNDDDDDDDPPAPRQPIAVDDPPPAPRGKGTGGGGGGGGGGSRTRPKGSGGGSKPKAPPKAEPSVDPPSPSAKGKAGAVGAERRNAAITVVAQPQSFEAKSMAKRDDQSPTDWLTNVAYWSTYPEAPTKLNPSDPTHKTYIAAWARTRGHVERGLALLPQLGQHPVAPNSPQAVHDDWHRWALAVSFASSLSSASELRSAFAKAWNYIFLDPTGVQWMAKHRGTSVAGITARTDGLLAESAVVLAKSTLPEANRQLQLWPENMSKAYAAANHVMRNA